MLNKYFTSLASSLVVKMTPASGNYYDDALNVYATILPKTSPLKFSAVGDDEVKNAFEH